MIDLFARQAAVYAAFRPTYPEEVIKYVLSFVQGEGPGKILDACDIGCGNGQITFPLAKSGLFRKVIGIDKSVAQLSHLPKEHGLIPGSVEFKPGDATDLRAAGIQDKSCSLLTAAQMMHWLTSDTDTWERMQAEASRVLVPESGRFAVIGYGICNVKNDEEVDKKFQETYQCTLDRNLWDRNCDRLLLDNQFKEGSVDWGKGLEVVDRRSFSSVNQMPLGSFAKYVSTWSAFTHDQSLLDEFNQDPVICSNPDKKIDVDFPFFAVILKRRI